MKKPLVSVVMSVYNSEKWLPNTIDSIIRQTYTNFEFIIINDGSTDNSKEILDEYTNRDKRIFVFHQKNIGLTKSLIKAIKLSKGDIIARIDADDLSSKERIEEQLKELEKQNLDLIATNFSLIDVNGKKTKYFDIRKKQEEILEKLLGGNSFFPHSSVMFKKEAYYKLGGYNLFFNKSQDIDLWIRFIQKNYKIGICSLNKPLNFIRIHEEQITHKNDDDIFTSISILNFYCRSINRLEISEYNFDNKLKIINRIKQNKYYQVINFKNKIRFYKKNFLSGYFLNTIKELHGTHKFRLIKYIRIILMRDKEIYKHLANEILLRHEF